MVETKICNLVYRLKNKDEDLLRRVFDNTGIFFLIFFPLKKKKKKKLMLWVHIQTALLSHPNMWYSIRIVQICFM